MEIIPLADIAPILEQKSDIISAIRAAFISHARGEIKQPDPVQLLFRDPANALRGDCHIKTAAAASFPYFCIKTATGFYENATLGLPVNNGLVLLFSAETGAPLALFLDDGHLTSARTAAAGALAATVRNSDRPRRLGIIGTGHQAELQARWITHTVPVSRLSIYGRNPDKAAALAARLNTSGLNAAPESSLAQLCANADTLVTTTPAAAPILLTDHIQPGHHIIAMGADSPGKCELDPHILARADLILTDDTAQCLHHGEFGHAVRAGLIDEDIARPLGQSLADANTTLSDQAISVVDLTGLGAQDLYIAAFVKDRLAAPPGN